MSCQRTTQRKRPLLGPSRTSSAWHSSLLASVHGFPHPSGRTARGPSYCVAQTSFCTLVLLVDLMLALFEGSGVRGHRGGHHTSTAGPLHFNRTVCNLDYSLSLTHSHTHAQTQFQQVTTTGLSCPQASG